MGRVRIIVDGVGAFPGMTRGDVVENPTEAQIAYAKANPNQFSVQVIANHASKGGGAEGTVKEDGGNPSQTRRRRKDI